jgi:peroxiredoxin
VPTVTVTPHVLDRVRVLDLEGTQVRLGTLWANHTAVLLFVRHFGCLFCGQQVADIVPFVDGIRDAGAELFVIGNGSVDQARTFRDRHTLPMPLFTDPDRQAFRALAMRSGVSTVLNLSVIARSLAALKAGFRQTRVAGDPFQLGGVVVIGVDGLERYRYLSRFAGDHPDPAAILRHCRSESPDLSE